MLPSSGKAMGSQPAICSGDQHNPSLASTTARNLGARTNLHGLGRAARRSAAASARWARYRRRPPLRASSRDTVDGARPSRRAIARQESPVATPRLISSRSAAVNDRAAHCGGRCCMPLVCNTKARIEGHACPSGGQSAAATHLAASAARAPLALGPTVPRIAPTTSTADAPDTAEAMQPSLETTRVSATLIA
jgi:hypothetical protein